MNSEKIKFISYDETINEIFDKKMGRYLVYHKDIIKNKFILSNTSNILNNTTNDKEIKDIIEINDIYGENHNINKKVIEEYNENNITYQWYKIKDINDKEIIVKKEHLLNEKMVNEEIEIMDYYGKIYKIIPGKVCYIAKKTHATIGLGNETINYRIKDKNGEEHFINKLIINFAKEKRDLNDELNYLEITDINNKIINIPNEIIRDLDLTNIYNEWCEIEDINKNKIMVKKSDLNNIREIYDKNIVQNFEIQEINDYKLNVYKINIDEEYTKYFPDKFYYLKNGKSRDEFSEVYDINNNLILIKTSLIEFYLTENLYDLPLYEEVYDKKHQKQIINPVNIIKNILLSYDDINCNNGPLVNIITQSGSKHFIKICTIEKILKISKELNNNVNDNNNIVSIKDSKGNKILTNLYKIKNINLNNDNELYFSLNDINNEEFFVSKYNLKQKVNEFLTKEIVNDKDSNLKANFNSILNILDINNIEKKFNSEQIKIINYKLKKYSYI